MDYFRVLLKTVSLVLILANIASCTGDADSGEPQLYQVELSRAPIQLHGEPPRDVFYGSRFETKFSVDGGTGKYNISYDSTVESSDSTFISENQLDFHIDVGNDETFEYTFVLEGIVKPPTDLDEGGSLNEAKIEFQIIVDDGINKEEFPFEIVVKENKLKIANASQAAPEGRAIIDVYERLIAFQASGGIGICDNLADEAPRAKLIDGKYAYPVVYQASLTSRMEELTEIHYRVTSSYLEGVSSRLEGNLEEARPGVDFIVDGENGEDFGRLIFGPGDNTCVVPIYIVDDYLSEKTELFTIEFFNPYEESTQPNIPVNLTESFLINLTDNEPTLKYETKQVVVNEGDSVTYSYEINKQHETPVEFNVFADPNSSTADQEDFTISPLSGVVSVDVGSRIAESSVQILKNEDNEIKEEDDLLVIKNDIDFLINTSDFNTIEINEWLHDQSVIDFSDSVFREAIGMSISSGSILTLFKEVEDEKINVRVKRFFRDGSPLNFSASEDLFLTHDQFDLIPKDMTTVSAESNSRMFLLLEVTGNYAGSFRGGKDFVVMEYSKSGVNAPYQFVGMAQYGSEGDDVAEGIEFFNNNIYVYGSTNGKRLEGEGPAVAPKGGLEGFVYSIRASDLSVSWATFIGTEVDDRVVGLGAARKEVVVLLENAYESLEGSTRILFTSSGAELKLEDDVFIASFEDDFMADIVMDERRTGYASVHHSRGDESTSSGKTPSLSQDVFMTAFESDDATGSKTSIATSEDDFVVDIDGFEEGDYKAIGGYTYGVFEDNVKSGENGTSDAFIAIVQGSSARSFEVIKNIQFGTEENDKLIDVEWFSPNKLMALWSSEVEGQSQLEYKISTFSSEGIKLSSPN